MTRLEECSEDGSNRLPDSTIGAFGTYWSEERLRNEEGRGRPKVVVGIVRPVVVELELAVVPIEVQRVREVAIGVRRVAFVRPSHRNSNTVHCWKQGVLLLLNLM